MKSNKEFLEGVYKKAEEIESLKGIDEKKKHFTINLKTVAAAVAVVVLIPFSLKILESENNTSRKVVPEGYVVMESEEGPKNRSNEFETNTFQYDDLHNMIYSSSIIAIGEIISLEESNIYIKTSNTLKGRAMGSIISISRPEDADINPSEEVLVFLREGETSNYILTESSNSLFKLYTVIDNNKIFKSLEGFELTLEELDNLIRGG